LPHYLAELSVALRMSKDAQGRRALIEEIE
jgi:hypothetical protein